MSLLRLRKQLRTPAEAPLQTSSLNPSELDSIQTSSVDMWRLNMLQVQLLQLLPCSLQSGSALDRKLSAFVSPIVSCFYSIVSFFVMPFYTMENTTPLWSYTKECLPPCEWKNQFPSGHGREQSPIDFIVQDIKTKHGTCDDSESLSWKNMDAEGFPTKSNVNYIWDITHGSMTTMWNTTEWNLIQFHLHIPSEHTINGMHNDVEIHFVHANACGELLVMGVMLTITNTSSVGLELILGSMENPSLIPVGPMIDEFMTTPAAFMSYKGSLTTPPCTQGVTWFVRSTLKSCSKTQFKRLHSIMSALPGTHQGCNARAVQPLHRRCVSMVLAEQ